MALINFKSLIINHINSDKQNCFSKKISKQYLCCVAKESFSLAYKIEFEYWLISFKLFILKTYFLTSFFRNENVQRSFVSENKTSAS